MTGGGLGNSGIGNLGIYGQQSWQREAQDKEFREGIYKRMQQMGPVGQLPMSRLKAQYETAGQMGRESGGSALAGGATMYNYQIGALDAGLRLRGQAPAAGQEGAQDWWNKMQTFRFPDTGGMRY
jgi:hypothetical protein